VKRDYTHSFQEVEEHRPVAATHVALVAHHAHSARSRQLLQLLHRLLIRLEMTSILFEASLNLCLPQLLAARVKGVPRFDEVDVRDPYSPFSTRPPQSSQGRISTVRQDPLPSSKESMWF